MKLRALSFTKQGLNSFTFHMDTLEEGDLTSSLSKSGLSWNEAKTYYHIVSDYLLSVVDPTNGVNWDGAKKGTGTCLALSEDARELYIGHLKKKTFDLSVTDSRRFIVIDFAHHSLDMFFGDDPVAFRKEKEVT